MMARIAPTVRKYANVGVRIEDDYVVTGDGVQWISCVPREADEVEALMRQPVKGPQERNAAWVDWYGATVVDPKAARAGAAPAPRACTPRM
jgi:Xaa-Pro aminopeptidase